MLFSIYINELVFCGIWSLTTGTDAIGGTSGDDTITADAGTVQATDVIEDTSEADNDTLNVVIDADAVAFTVQKVENINATLDVLTGAAGTIDADNFAGATVTINAGKAVDGVGEVVNAEANNVTAGTGITSLSVTGITASTVDAGSAATLITDDANGATDVTTAVVNGDVDWTVTTGNAAANVKLSATAASVVNLNANSTLTAGTTVTVTGDNDVTLDSGDELDGMTVVDASNATVKVDVDAAGALDASAWTVDSIILSEDISNTVTSKTGQTYEVTKAQTALVIDSNSALNQTTNIKVGVSSTSITTSNSGAGANTLTNVEVTADATLSTLDTADKLVVTGASTLTIGQTDADELDMSAYTGNTTVTSDSAATSTTIELGSGTNKLTLGNVDYTVAGGTGVDTIVATAVAGGGASDLVSISLNAGDDIVKLDNGGAVAAYTLNIFGGEGSDTLWLGNAVDTTSMTDLTLTGVERVEVENQTGGADTTSVTIDSSDVSGKTIEIFSNDALDTISVTVTADAATVDFSTVTQTNIDTLTINGRGTADDTIIGTAGKDVIDANAAGNSVTVTGGAGVDTFVVNAADAGTDGEFVITDYTANEDKIDIATTSVLADVTTGQNVGTNAGLAAAAVKAVVADGVMTLVGLSADVAAFDTLAEWVAAANVVHSGASVLAFEFGGNTYLSEAAAGTATEVIKLTGVTGITAVSTTAAADTIQIA